jgi:hypothetical protein
LKPSLPVDAAAEPGTIRLEINHANDAGTQEEQKGHRLFPNVPAADVRPPEGVLSVSLQSIHLSLDILKTSPRWKPTAKRLHTSPGERQPMASEPKDSNIPSYEMASVARVPHGHNTSQVPSNPKPAANRKRKRLATDTIMTTQPELFERAEISKRSCRLPATDSFVQHSPHPDSASSCHGEIENLVDGALRLSICGVLNKSANGAKAKASTFRLGLADIAPVLWRNGYLGVSKTGSECLT